MGLDVRGRKPGVNPEDTANRARSDIRHSVQVSVSLLPEGLHSILDIPYIGQETGVTCFWACCLAVQRALSIKYGNRLMYLPTTEAELTQKARRLGYLQGGTLGTESGLLGFVNQELGVSLSNPASDVTAVAQKPFTDLSQGNTTLICFPHQSIAHWNVVRGVYRSGNQVTMSLMDPIFGNIEISQDQYVNRLLFQSKEGVLLSASALTVVTPKLIPRSRRAGLSL